MLILYYPCSDGLCTEPIVIDVVINKGGNVVWTSGSSTLKSELLYKMPYHYNSTCRAILYKCNTPCYINIIRMCVSLIVQLMS